MSTEIKDEKYTTLSDYINNELKVRDTKKGKLNLQ